mmetsp:Transcript_9530/g.28801  ORF Transcript_9530/g.28801 Transcript_9530/m.28801 type:complete len:207 (+) Transcript_9530:1023-1643(+)
MHKYLFCFLTSSVVPTQHLGNCLLLGKRLWMLRNRPSRLQASVNCLNIGIRTSDYDVGVGRRTAHSLARCRIPQTNHHFTQSVNSLGYTVHLILQQRHRRLRRLKANLLHRCERGIYWPRPRGAHCRLLSVALKSHNSGRYQRLSTLNLYPDEVYGRVMHLLHLITDDRLQVPVRHFLLLVGKVLKSQKRLVQLVFCQFVTHLGEP